MFPQIAVMRRSLRCAGRAVASIVIISLSLAPWVWRSRLGRFAARDFRYRAAAVETGTGDFTTAIVGRLGVLNALWLAGPVPACEVARLLNLALRRQTS